MKKAGTILRIVIDSWKLSVFVRRLKADGYKWTQHDGPMKELITLKVRTGKPKELYETVRAAQLECEAN